MLQDVAVYKIVKNFLPQAFDSFGRDYETRLKVQKLMYLFGQLCNQNIYNHTWYYAGPYSPTLSRQIYNDILPKMSLEEAVWNNATFTESANNVLSTLKLLLENSKEIAPNFSTPQIYEAVASIWYIANNSNDDNLTDYVLNKLIAEKPHLNSTNTLNLVVFVLERREEISRQNEEN